MRRTLDPAKPPGPMKKDRYTPHELPFDPNIPVTGILLADFLGLIPPRVTELVQEGHLARIDNGKFPLRDTIRSYCEWQRAEARRNTRGALASKLQEAKARAVDIDTALKEGQLIDVREAVERFAFTFGALRSAFNGLAARVSSDRDVRLKIEHEVNQIFDQAVQSFEEEPEPAEEE